VAVRHGLDHSVARGPPAVQAGQVGLDPGLVEEDEPAGVEAGPLEGAELGPLGRDVRAGLLGGGERLFF
jgi:hypothetical protein